MAHLSRGALTFWLTGSLEGGRIDLRLLPLQMVSTVCGLLLIGRRCHFGHNRVRMQHFSFANLRALKNPPFGGSGLFAVQRWPAFDAFVVVSFPVGKIRSDPKERFNIETEIGSVFEHNPD
jgi:hypothetical protein